MVMKKKVLSMLMGVSILAAALAGCGKAPASTENSAPAPAATDSAQAAETPEAAESAAGTQAVSYTHLDVYKRQQSGFTGKAALAHRAEPFHTASYNFLIHIPDSNRTCHRSPSLFKSF